MLSYRKPDSDANDADANKQPNRVTDVFANRVAELFPFDFAHDFADDFLPDLNSYIQRAYLVSGHLRTNRLADNIADHVADQV